jgi:hypothetical protein
MCFSVLVHQYKPKEGCEKGSFFASNQYGDLFEIDYKRNDVKKHVTFILSSLEIVFDVASGTFWSESLGDGFFWERYDTKGNLILSATLIFPGIAFTALAYAGELLYGAGFHTESCDESFCPTALMLIETSTKTIQTIGYIGNWQISGLSYDEKNDILYGITDGALPAKLVVVDRETGSVTEVGKVTVEGEPLESVGSIEFDGEGLLRGCLRETDYQPDQLLTIDPTTGIAEFSGVSMNGLTCTGLTLVCK